MLPPVTLPQHSPTGRHGLVRVSRPARRGNNDCDMWLWVPAVPLALGLMLWTLSRLETYLVAPVEHAERISTLMRRADTDQLETEVARLLAPSVEVALRRSARRRTIPVA